MTSMPKANDKDVYYFSHDCNARNDEKILALRSVYGLEGYAVYFMLIEILREQPTYRLPITKYIYNTLAMQMQCEADKIESIVHDCCNEFVNESSALLKISDGFLYSESLLRRMEKVDSTSKSRQEAAFIRWNKQEQCTSNANAEQEQCYKKKQDESKKDEKKKKENKTITDFFESVWLLYPEKKGKGQVSDTQKAKLHAIGYDEIKRCIDRYKADKEDWKKWQNGSTFFNSGYIDYLDENYHHDKLQEELQETGGSF